MRFPNIRFDQECNKSHLNAFFSLSVAPPPPPIPSVQWRTRAARRARHVRLCDTVLALEEVIGHALATLRVVLAALVRRRREHVEEHAQRLVDLQH